MTVIKNLAFADKQKLKALESFKEADLNVSDFLPFPIDLLHHFLPFRLKFLDESFVSVDERKITGLLTVQRVGSKRAKISRLLSEGNSLETGKFLVDCTVSFLLSKGAESFYVVIDKRNDKLINMFMEGCGFKNLAREIVYKINSNDFISDLNDISFSHIRKMTTIDIKEVKTLINDTMHSYQRAIFYKNSYEFKYNFFNRIKQYVLTGEKSKDIIAFFAVSKIKKGEYFVDFVISPSYEGYLSDIIQFVKIRLSKIKDFKVLYVKLKSYYYNFEELNEMLKIEYKNSNENIILTKNFLTLNKETVGYEKMIFNDATPAF